MMPILNRLVELCSSRIVEQSWIEEVARRRGATCLALPCPALLAQRDGRRLATQRITLSCRTKICVHAKKDECA